MPLTKRSRDSITVVGDFRFLESTLDKSKWKKISSETFSWDISTKATYFWHDEFWSKQYFQELAAQQLIESRAIEFSGHTVILTLKLLEIHRKSNVIVMMITSIITIASLLSNSWKYQLMKTADISRATSSLVSPLRAEIPYWWRITKHIGAVVLIGWKFDSSNQMHYSDLGSDTSAEWNFCARSSDVISQGNRWRSQETSAVFSGKQSNVTNSA